MLSVGTKKRLSRIHRRALPEVVRVFEDGQISARRADQLLYLEPAQQLAQLQHLLSVREEARRRSKIAAAVIKAHIDSDRRDLREREAPAAAFWNQFVSGDDQRTVARETAIYVTKTIVCEAVGPRYGNQPIVFKEEPVTVSDVLSVIERLCGGPAGSQHLQKKAGIQPGPGA